MTMNRQDRPHRPHRPGGELEGLFDLWLAQERGGAKVEPEAAEEAAGPDLAFARLYRALPLEAPSPTFAARTLERLAEQRRAAAAVAATGAAGLGALWTWARRAAALWLLVASGAAIWLAGLLASGAVGAPSRDGVGTLARVSAATWEWVVAGLAFWQRLGEVADLVARIVTVPQIALGLLASTLVAAIAFRLLRHLLADERDLRHVESI